MTMGQFWDGSHPHLQVEPRDGAPARDVVGAPDRERILAVCELQEEGHLMKLPLGVATVEVPGETHGIPSPHRNGPLNLRPKLTVPEKETICLLSNLKGWKMLVSGNVIKIEHADVFIWVVPFPRMPVTRIFTCLRGDSDPNLNLFFCHWKGDKWRCLCLGNEKT